MTLLKKKISSADHMIDFGKHVATRAIPPFQIHLIGQIGAGKTTFARGFILGLGFVGPVKSPTFTIVETYSKGSCTVSHFDLFRLKSAEELVHIGFDDYFDSNSIILIEWPELALGVLPNPDLTIRIGVSGDSREILSDHSIDTKNGTTRSGDSEQVTFEHVRT